ncbi:hypothetical protein B5807_06707 [Epicoccum nigrum]|uniref:F-box domain-containing protein n=1 Tax=Epicoccum nigrum TaxID=105696 RepID=A0A1Y2LVY9_EPING|nr:hypothetical protein B5807_06707 [Epicoccum nigrum]
MPAKIPQLECIISMSMEDLTSHIAEADIIALTDSLPSLKECVVSLYDRFEWGRRYRIKRRKDLADSVSQRKFLELQRLTLWANYHDQYEETFDPTGLISEGANDTDFLIKIMRHLATVPQLTTLHLTGCHIISDKFFQDLPSFPVLSDFQLIFS